MAIQNLTIPFPDFKFNETINPEEFDANNDAFKVKVNEIITLLSSHGFDGVTKTVMDGDFNSLDENGFYMMGGASQINNPLTASSFMYVINLKYASDSRKQIAFNMGGFEMYIRHQVAGVWYGWRQISGNPVWKALPLWSPWVNLGGNNPAEYFVDGNGICHLRGVVQRPSTGAWMAVFDSSVKIANREVFSTISGVSPFRIDASPYNGGTLIEHVDGTYNTFVTLSGIKFQTV